MRCSLVTYVISTVLLVASIPSAALSKERHVWQTGKIVSYDVPAPFAGRMINGRYSQPFPPLGSFAPPSSYTIQADGHLLYCIETGIFRRPPAIVLQSDVRFYREKKRLVLIDESGAERKAQVWKEVRLH